MDTVLILFIVGAQRLCRCRKNIVCLWFLQIMCSDYSPAMTTTLFPCILMPSISTSSQKKLSIS